MKKKVFIITGTSRGIGESIARKLIRPDVILISISRVPNSRLSVQAEMAGCTCYDLAFDLAEVTRIPDLIHRVFSDLFPSDLSEITLINNAGTIKPIRLVGEIENVNHHITAFSINLIAPVLITECFLKETSDWDLPVKIVNLSTGAASYPIEGWSSYCASKAGMDMFTRVVALEQQRRPRPAMIVGFAPGIVDTEMQAEIREAKEENFPDHQRFVEYKQKGELRNPNQVAEAILSYLENPEFGQKPLVRIDEV